MMKSNDENTPEFKSNNDRTFQSRKWACETALLFLSAIKNNNKKNSQIQKHFLPGALFSL